MLTVILSIVCFVGLLLGFLALREAGRSQKASDSRLGFVLLAVGIGSGYFLTQTGGFELGLRKMQADYARGTWLIIDNSGGETLRHWVVESGYVESSTQSDGWQFYDDAGNLCYVSGDAFVMRVNENRETFDQTYRARFAIPSDQIALK